MSKGRDQGRGRSKKRWGRLATVENIEEEDEENSEGEKKTRSSLSGTPMPVIDPWDTRDDYFGYRSADF